MNELPSNPGGLAAIPDGEQADDSAGRATLRHALLAESRAMLRHLLASGAGVRAEDIREVEGAEAHGTTSLAAAHARLARAVAPAKPGTIAYVEQLRGFGRAAGTTGQPPLLRHTGRVAISCLAAFLLVGIYVQADARPEITLGNEVVRAFLHQFLWIDAAALGASCAMLGKLHAQTRDRTFDPASALQVVLHTLFGFVCAVAAVAMLPLGAANPMLRPVLGLAVGSAASAVDMMLVRLAEAAAVMFQQVDANARPGNRMAAAMAAAEQEQSEERIRIAGQLIGIQESITSGLARDQIADRLGRLARGLRASAEPNDVLYPRAS